MINKFNEELSEEFGFIFDKIFIEALRLKGIEFENKKETEEFVRANCVRIIKPNSQIEVFKVKSIPFLSYDKSLCFNPQGNPFEFSFNLGVFKYL